jgi:hypothetical protein
LSGKGIIAIDYAYFCRYEGYAGFDGFLQARAKNFFVRFSVPARITCRHKRKEYDDY